jgi:hypothetical protein
MVTIVILLGVALLLGVLYLFYMGATVPPAIQKVLLLAIAIYLLLCVAHQAGCSPPFLFPRPTEIHQ